MSRDADRGPENDARSGQTHDHWLKERTKERKDSQVMKEIILGSTLGEPEENRQDD